MNRDFTHYQHMNHGQLLQLMKCKEPPSNDNPPMIADKYDMLATIIVIMALTMSIYAGYCAAYSLFAHIFKWSGL